AVLKTLGFSDGLILSMVLLESALIAIVGGGLGLALSYTFITFSGAPTGRPAAAVLLPDARRRHGHGTGACARSRGRIPARLAGQPAPHRRRAPEKLNAVPNLCGYGRPPPVH